MHTSSAISMSESVSGRIRDIFLDVSILSSSDPELSNAHFFPFPTLTAIGAFVFAISLGLSRVVFWFRPITLRGTWLFAGTLLGSNNIL